VTRWQRYWFADGGRIAAGCVRIAIAIGVLICLHKLGKPVSTGDLPGHHTLYRPIGIWMVFGHHAPPDRVVAALRVAAWASTIAMLVGLWSRLATAISCVSVSALAALAFAASHAWSHQYNVVLLAQLAFVGARSGDALAIDALLAPHHVARGYQWSLRLAQLAVALMFAGAAFHKLASGHFTLRWALSDNLRNQLLVRFDLASLKRPPLVEWLVSDPWHYKTAALLNLIAQALPIVACLLVRRPKLRALAGLAFVIETIALGLVVGLWNWQWLPLYAVFVDWDALFRIAPGAGVAPPPRWGVRIWIAAFVAYELFTSFVPGVDQRIGTYPFSSFPMFGGILARPPFDEHADFAIAGDRFEVSSDVPIDEATQRWFDHANRGMYAVGDPAELHVRLAALLAQAQRRYPTFGIHRVRSELALYVAPAYPAPAHFDVDPVAIVGDVGDDGSFRTRLGPLTPLHVATAGPKLAYLEAGETIYVTAIERDGTWLVASGGGAGDEW
jgi:hypothetical protein